MPQKKTPRNAFYFFMQDWKKKEEAKGRRFPGGLKDVANDCGEAWKNLSPQLKGPYEAEAKIAKVRDRGSNAKYSSTGVPLLLIEKAAQKKKEYEDNMNTYIENTINMAANRDSLMSMRFYLIHVNWYCRKILENNELDFYPAEFGVAEFSLRHGVENVYHEIVNIDIPLGYAREVSEHSEESHKIPRNLPEGQSDFCFMYDKLMKILMPETIMDKLPPLYTTKSNTDAVASFLKRLTAAAGKPDDYFLIYSLETLFLHMRNAAAQKITYPAVPIAESELQKDVFAFAPDIACSFHKSLDGSIVHCSRSVVHRWAFTLCDNCCGDLGIKLVNGRHVPINTDSDRFRSTNQKLMSMTINESRPSTALSITGVSEKHRLETSERTYDEEQKRRNQATTLSIIDHSKAAASTAAAVPVHNNNNAKPAGAYASVAAKIERPLRPPRTVSYAMVGAETEQVPELDEMNFPAIGGRGSFLRKQVQLPSIGRGRGISHK